jgi:hypothetical protein
MQSERAIENALNDEQNRSELEIEMRLSGGMMDLWAIPRRWTCGRFVGDSWKMGLVGDS